VSGLAKIPFREGFERGATFSRAAVVFPGGTTDRCATVEERRFSCPVP